jgi:hypothetical protein
MPFFKILIPNDSMLISNTYIWHARVFMVPHSEGLLNAGEFGKR